MEPRLLGGRYELGAVLGYGGMAEVFAARDTRLGREVAVKILRADLARDPTFLGRFRREAQSAAGLNHPNIVAVYDTGEDLVDGTTPTPYIVMEYVSGRTLRDVLTEDGRLLPRRAMEICAEVASALEYSHRAGIVHRDIKPGNVMLTRTGEIKVMDFGIARAAASGTADMTQTAQVLGTAQYLSPEQARGEHVDARSDIYSTGCLLYELLTGVPPFQGESAVAVAYQHVREDPIPPSRLDPELPASVDAVVLKAMAKNPANRYQDAGEMRADLERASAGRRVEAPAVLPQDATSAMPAAAPSTVLLSHDDADRGGRRTAAYVALGVAVVLVLVAAALITRSLFTGSKASVKTPRVIGQTEQQAMATLANLGLKVGKVTPNPEGTDNNTQPSGVIYAQSPVANIKVNAGGSVDIFVSSGTKQVQVPNDLVGKSQADAIAELKNLGLTATTTPSNTAGTPGSVLSVSPSGGAAVGVGSSVTLTVVSGQQTVPDVEQQQVADATQTLISAGFKVKTNPRADDSDAGTVIDQNPSAGSSADNGSTVTLTVSSGPSQSPSDTPSATPTDSGGGNGGGGNGGGTSATPGPGTTASTNP